MLAIVGFEEMWIPAIIGVYSEERTQKQDLFLTLSVQVNISKAVGSDSIEDALDYTLLAQMAKDLAAEGFQLLETFAGQLVQAVMKLPGVESVHLKVRKPAGVPGSEGSFVEVNYGREV